MTILFDKQRALLAFLHRTARRMQSGRRAAGTLWGCAMIVALLATTVALLKTKPVAMLGVLFLLLTVLLLGLASAAAAQSIEQRLSDSAEWPATQNSWPSSGWKTLVLAAALPIAGWICGAAFLTAALGAMGELTVARLARRD